MLRAAQDQWVIFILGPLLTNGLRKQTVPHGLRVEILRVLQALQEAQAALETREPQELQEQEIKVPQEPREVQEP